MPSSAKSITVQLIKRASLERWFTVPTFCIWRHITCTRYVINQVCVIDGHIGLSVWHWMNSNNQKSRKRYLQISNSNKSFDIYICKFIYTDDLILLCMYEVWIIYINKKSIIKYLKMPKTYWKCKNVKKMWISQKSSSIF